MLKNASNSGKLSVRTLGLPTPDDDGTAVSSLSTEYTVDKSTGELTVAVLDRQVRFVGTPWKMQ